MGSQWQARLAIPAAALWWGSLTTICFIVVPLLFVHLPSSAMAGRMAARLFSAQTWITLACGMLLIMGSRSQPPSGEQGVSAALPYLLGGMVLALLVEFAVAPRIVARENLRLWHGLGSGMYVLQWLCAGVVLWRVGAAQAVRGPGAMDAGSGPK
jgi:hypothetical protein